MQAKIDELPPVERPGNPRGVSTGLRSCIQGTISMILKALCCFGMRLRGLMGQLGSKAASLCRAMSSELLESVCKCFTICPYSLLTRACGGSLRAGLSVTLIVVLHYSRLHVYTSAHISQCTPWWYTMSIRLHSTPHRERSAEERQSPKAGAYGAKPPTISGHAGHGRNEIVGGRDEVKLLGLRARDSVQS